MKAKATTRHSDVFNMFTKDGRTKYNALMERSDKGEVEIVRLLDMKMMIESGDNETGTYDKKTELHIFAEWREESKKEIPRPPKYMESELKKVDPDLSAVL